MGNQDNTYRDELFYRFITRIASMTMDGEDNGFGQPFVPGGEDTIETLDTLIAEARHLLTVGK